VESRDERRLTSSRLAIAISCGIAACLLGGLTVMGLMGVRRLVDWSTTLMLLIYGLPAGLAAAGAIGIVTRRRWGLVAARVFAAVAVAAAGLLCFLLIVTAVMALFVSGGDAAPPSWYLVFLACIPGLVAALALVLLRSSTAELQRWDKDLRPPLGAESA
jgi:hypothetical protein